MKIPLNLKVLSLLVLLVNTIGKAQNVKQLVNTVAENSTESFAAYEKLFYKSLEDIDTTFCEETTKKFNNNPNLKYKSPSNAIRKGIKIRTYCKKNKIDFKADSLRTIMIGLYQELSDFERFNRDKILMKSLTLTDISTLEFYGFLLSSYGSHEYFEAFEFDVSLNKIMDVIYYENWNQIIHSSKLLRAYVFKCMLFSHSSTTQRSYFRRFENQPLNLRTKLLELHKKENDPTLKQGYVIAIKMLEKKLPQASKLELDISYQEFLNYGSNTNEMTSIFVKIEKTDWEAIFQKIEHSKTQGELQSWCHNLKEIVTIDAVHYLIKLLNDNRIYRTKTSHARFIDGSSRTYKHDVYVSDVSLFCLQKIFKCDVPGIKKKGNKQVKTYFIPTRNKRHTNGIKNHWKKYYKKNKKSVNEWVNNFSLDQLNQVLKADSISSSLFVKTFNRCKLDSNRKLLLNNMFKLKETADLKGIYFRKGESYPIEILKFFKNKEIYWDDYFELLDNVKHKYEDLIKIDLAARLATYSQKHKVKLVVRLLYTSWFKTFLTRQKQDTSFINNITDLYHIEKQHYQSSYSDLSLFFVNTIYKSPHDKIDYLIQNRLTSSMDISEYLLTRLDWKSTIYFVKQWDKLSLNFDSQKRRILTKELGLALPTYDSLSIALLNTNMDSLPEIDVRKKYLIFYGFDVLNNNGELDLNKTNTALNYHFSENGFETRGNGAMVETIYPLIFMLKLHYNIKNSRPNFWLSKLAQDPNVPQKINTSLITNFNYPNARSNIWE